MLFSQLLYLRYDLSRKSLFYEVFIKCSIKDSEEIVRCRYSKSFFSVDPDIYVFRFHFKCFSIQIHICFSCRLKLFHKLLRVILREYLSVSLDLRAEYWPDCRVVRFERVIHIIRKIIFECHALHVQFLFDQRCQIAYERLILAVYKNILQRLSYFYLLFLTSASSERYDISDEIHSLFYMLIDQTFISYRIICQMH